MTAAVESIRIGKPARAILAGAANVFSCAQSSAFATVPEPRQCALAAERVQPHRARPDPWQLEVHMPKAECALITTAKLPKPVTSRAEAYEFRIPDDLNAPIIRAGYTAYVDPMRPPSVGGWVRVFPKGSDAFLAVLDGRGDADWTFRVMAKPGLRRYNSDEIDRIELVTGIIFQGLRRMASRARAN